jgi:hypothetical protein
MNCDHCNKEFSNKSNLVRHKKKCLIKNNKPSKIFECEFCSKELCSNFSLNRHLNICKVKKNQIEELKSMVIHLQDEIKEIKKSSPVTSNITNNRNTNTNSHNTINNNITINNIDFMSYMTAERIKDVFDNNYNVQTLLGSEKSLANFTIDNFLSGEDRPIYLCSDKDRNKFYFLDKNNKRIDDTNAQILINLIITYGFDSIKKYYNTNNKKIEINEAFTNVMKLKKDGKEYINQLSTSLPKTIEERQIRDNLNDIQLSKENNTIIKFEEDEEIEFYKEIGGIPMSILCKYKKHYIDTSVIMVPSNFVKTKETLSKYKKYLNN